MAEKNTPSLQSQWRIDAVAVTLFGTAALLAVAVGSSRALTGGARTCSARGETARQCG